jgi:predicted DsbA family dithiol-disulfide isomerase
MDLLSQEIRDATRKKLEAEEATEFPHLVQKYGVYGVPKTIFNDTIALDGAVPEEVFLANVLEAAARRK